MSTPAGTTTSRPAPAFRQAVEPVDREQSACFNDNPQRHGTGQPFSTFCLDVDTGTCDRMTHLLDAGDPPRRDASRTGERVNDFSCDYPRPDRRGTPFSIASGVVRSACKAAGKPSWYGCACATRGLAASRARSSRDRYPGPE